MLYEVRQGNDGSWRVHTPDFHGAPLIAYFEGPNARQAAKEYATWRECEDQFTALQAVMRSLEAP